MAGRLLSGGARGPGVFFIIPCVDMYEKIDMRVQNFDVPPQEVLWGYFDEVINTAQWQLFSGYKFLDKKHFTP